MSDISHSFFARNSILESILKVVCSRVLMRLYKFFESSYAITNISQARAIHSKGHPSVEKDWSVLHPLRETKNLYSKELKLENNCIIPVLN